MASNENSKIASSLDLENEIPFTAIVDIHQTKLLLNDSYFCIKSHNQEINNIVKNKVSPDIDIKTLCRICLSKENNMISLMSKSSHYTLAEIYTAITSIKVYPEGNLPTNICIKCREAIVHYYDFKVKCCNSNFYLKSLLKAENCAEQSFHEYSNKVDRQTQTNDDDVKIENYPLLDIKNESVNDSYGAKANPSTGVDENEDHEEVEYLDDELFLMSDSAPENINEGHSKRKHMSKEIKDFNLYVQKSVLKQGRVKKRLLSCDVCSKKFLKPKSLRAHLKECRNNSKVKKPYACAQCKESFICESDLNIHSALHVKDNNWTCNKCSKKFTERNRFRRHIQRHMESKRYACERCDKTFAERCALKRHVRVHTGEEPEKRFACQLCDKRFSDSSQLGVHTARHTGAFPCACDTCGKAFPSRRLLASHRRVHSDLKQYACVYCEKRFRHESTRNTHHRTHTGEKPYVCSICGKTFIQNSNLKLHMRTHTGEKPYTCDVCGRKFTSGSSLTSHRRTHTGEKPYSCPICGKRFARTDIRTHLRQHNGEKPFACCACPKAFVNAARLRDHYLIHTGEKAYECAICSEQFKRKSYLAKHLRTHEKNNKVTNNGLVIVQQLPLVMDDNIIFAENDSTNINNGAELNLTCENVNKDVLVTEEIPLEVSGELILQDDNNMKTELVVVDNGHATMNFQGSSLNEATKYDNSDINDVNLLTVNEQGVNISSASVLEGTTMKLYQLDQSLVQIHTSEGQVTIRKITSKMTANF